MTPHARRPIAAVSAIIARRQKLRALLAEPIYRRALLYRVAATVEHDQTPLAHEYCTVVDIGANRGQFALVATRRFPGAALICVEPQSGPLGTLNRVLSGHPRLRVVEAALSATAGPSVMYISEADDSSSLLPVTDLQLAAFPNTQTVRQVDVATHRLDELLDPQSLERPLLIKIDVQGSELEVLRGAAGLLGCVDSILVECSFVELYAGQALANDVLSFLGSHGFRLAHIVAPTLDDSRRLVQADLVFERADSP